MGLWQMPLCLTTLIGLVRTVHSHGTAMLTLSENPVYSGETVMLICNYGANNLLVAVEINAFHGSDKKGSLSCSGPSEITNGTGIFSGLVFLPACGGSKPLNDISLSMVASQSLELDFTCTVTVVHDNDTVTTLTSATTSLLVDDLLIKPHPAIFNESDNATIKCESRHGTPTSALQLTIRSPNGSHISDSGNGSTSVVLPVPLVDWHNAIARCTMTNRFHSNISTTSLISVNHKRRSLNRGYEIQMTDNDLYASASLRFQPTGFTSAQLKNSNLVFYRLLVADKCVMADLSTMVLPTTVLMEYSSGSEALHEILAQLNLEISLPTTPNFKSVAIFLPTIENAKHRDEENQTRQSIESTTASNVEILEIFDNLAKLCLCQQSDSSGIDIFNYCGSDAASLAEMLTDALKVPVTVSYGYGFGESKDLKKLHASSAAKYFNFIQLAATPVDTYF